MGIIFLDSVLNTSGREIFKGPRDETTEYLTSHTEAFGFDVILGTTGQRITVQEFLEMRALTKARLSEPK
jgi:hypothetical protein